MENYIFINGQKIGLTEEQAEEIRASFGAQAYKLADATAGDVVKVGVHEFVVLEHREDGTALIRRELLCEEAEFGVTNNYAGSNVEKLCNGFAEELAAAIGEENVILHEVDLTSDDGLKDYGVIERRASLLTADMYRKFVQILDRHKPDTWWWLATPYSTDTHENSSWVKCGSPSGGIDGGIYDYTYGVRPFCILNSNIFVSKREEK